MDQTDTAWTPDEVAAELKISVRNLSNVRKNDLTFPKPRMLGDCPRWSPPLVRAWLAWEQPATEISTAPVPAQRKKGRIQ